MSKVSAVIQARMTSSRLPGKVLKQVLGKPLLEYMIERVQSASLIVNIIVATTTNAEDDPVAALAEDLGVRVYRGSEWNVLERFYLAANEHGLKYIMRLTADCPLIDPDLLDDLIRYFLSNRFDYVSNCVPPTLPDGLDAEIMSIEALEKSYRLATLPHHLEHVTQFIHAHPEMFTVGTLKHQPDLSEHRWTVDTEEDFCFVRKVIEYLYPRNKKFRLYDVLDLLKDNPELRDMNRHLIRNSSLKKTSISRPDLPSSLEVKSGIAVKKSPGSFIFRTDANTDIGTGHLMRCIALAQELTNLNGKVIFIGRIENESLRQRLADEEFIFIPLDDFKAEDCDIKGTLDYIENNFNKLNERITVVVDGYHFSTNYHDAIKNAGLALMVIDDNNHLPRYNADIILNQNAYAKNIAYNCSESCKKLLGSQYVLLRSEFLEKRRNKKIISEHASRILVTIGGSDPHNATSRIVKSLKQVGDQGLAVKIIVGPANRHYQMIEKELVGSSFKHDILFDVKRMDELIDWADFAVTAGGTSCYELSCLGVPFYTIITADNQRNVCTALDQKGITECLGWFSELVPEDLARRLRTILHDPLKRKNMSSLGRNEIDGLGRKRVARMMCVGEVSLRPVEPDDKKNLWVWANDGMVRENAFNSGRIDWKEHETWFENKLHNSNCLYLMALSEYGMPVGQIRFDIDWDKRIAEIDYSVSSEYRGLGIGGLILQEGIFFMRKNVTKPITLLARVKKENMVSAYLFEKMNFSFENYIHRINNKKFSCRLYRLNIEPTR